MSLLPCKSRGKFFGAACHHMMEVIPLFWLLCKLASKPAALFGGLVVMDIVMTCQLLAHPPSSFPVGFTAVTYNL